MQKDEPLSRPGGRAERWGGLSGSCITGAPRRGYGGCPPAQGPGAGPGHLRGPHPGPRQLGPPHRPGTPSREGEKSLLPLKPQKKSFPPAPKQPAGSCSGHHVFDPIRSRPRTLISCYMPSRVSVSGDGSGPSLCALELAVSWKDTHKRDNPSPVCDVRVAPGPALRPAGGCQGLTPTRGSRRRGFDGPERRGWAGRGPAVPRSRGTDHWCVRCSGQRGGQRGRGQGCGGW